MTENVRPNANTRFSISWKRQNKTVAERTLSARGCSLLLELMVPLVLFTRTAMHVDGEHANPQERYARYPQVTKLLCSSSRAIHGK